MSAGMILARFLTVTGRAPDAPAVLAEDRTWSYGELAGEAGGIARRLGDVRGERIGLLTDHGAPTIAAMLGILAAGGSYVPLDPSYPPARLRLLAADAEPSAILTTGAHAPLAAELGRPLLLDDAGRADLHPVDGGDGAYLLYTSGSTGRPKGVRQTQAAVLACADNQIRSLRIVPGDRLSLLASFSFDAAVPDVYGALLSGAAVAPMDVRRLGLGPVAVALADRAVSIYHSTPTVYRYLLGMLDAPLPRIRAVLLGGEPVRTADVVAGRGWFGPDCLLVNGYGATEATFVAQHQLRFDAEEPVGDVPIGTPLPGYEIDVDGTGELVVRGEHVAPGYWRSPALSAERFRAEGYRTGDRGRRRPDGTLLCLGRLDRQVKVRGQRVELGEVEDGLAALPRVAQAVAVVAGERLVGYVRPGPGSRPDGEALRRELADRLPAYAVPDSIVVVDELPLTPSGKVQVQALTDPPVTALERTVHDIWCDVLGRPAVGVADRFFDLGGHSLLLTQVQQRLAEVAGRPVELVALLAHPTVRGQARLLAADPEPRPDPVADEAAGDGDAIAVVGLACRFPGADDVPTFWANLCNGVDAVHDYSEDELRALGIGSALLADPAHVRAGGRVEGIEDVDAEFFGFGPEEAAVTDPQHRLLLEVGWAALEDAGCDPVRYPGPIGVFTSASVNRYFLFHLFGNPQVGDADPDDWDGRIAARQLPDHLPGQLAYRLGLSGPAVAVQSACSSSLAAVAVAAQSLLDFRCDLALAGGVSVTWPRQRATAGGMASPDGRCRAFDADAQGSGFSTGAGAVTLKRLADARADRDHVYAVLPGWAITNDGAARAGFAVPGPDGQAAAIAEALATAGVSAAEVGLVEAHGSGTPLGDAIEVSALTSVYRPAGATSVALGSVKTNIGHLDAAAGVAGLIKAVLAVRYGQIPATLHFTRPNPALDLGPFHVPTTLADWPEGRRMAAVSAFGLGGTNVHVLVGQDDEPAGPAPASSWLLPVSARSPRALHAMLRRLRDRLATAPDLAAADVTSTLALGRRAFPHRAVAFGRTLPEVVAALDALLADPGCGAAPVRPGRPAVVAPEVAGWLLPPGPDQDPVVVEDDGEVLAVVGRLWALGVDVDWDRLPPGRRVPLPAYAFQRRRHWIELPDREVS